LRSAATVYRLRARTYLRAPHLRAALARRNAAIARNALATLNGAQRRSSAKRAFARLRAPSRRGMLRFAACGSFCGSISAHRAASANLSAQRIVNGAAPRLSFGDIHDDGERCA